MKTMSDEINGSVSYGCLNKLGSIIGKLTGISYGSALTHLH